MNKPGVSFLGFYNGAVMYTYQSTVDYFVEECVLLVILLDQCVRPSLLRCQHGRSHCMQVARRATGLMWVVEQIPIRLRHIQQFQDLPQRRTMHR